MRKFAKFLIITCLVLSMGAGFVYASNKTSEENPVLSAIADGRIKDADVDYAFEIMSLEHLEKLSEIVIKGEILPDSENVVTEPLEKGLTGYTLTKVKVNEVFSGDVSVGEIITLYEPYFLTPLMDGKDYVITRAGYLPSKVGGEYVLFLVKNTWFGGKRYGAYEMYNTIMGRYPVQQEMSIMPATGNKTFQSNSEISKTISNDELDLRENADIPKYREIFNGVLDKYK